jgi:ankyrin repeat protein
VDAPVGARDHTPLQLAAGAGHADTVRALLRAGASAAYRSPDGLTAGDCASAMSRPDIAELIQSGGGVPGTVAKGTLRESLRENVGAAAAAGNKGPAEIPAATKNLLQVGIIRDCCLSLF